MKSCETFVKMSSKLLVNLLKQGLNKCGTKCTLRGDKRIVYQQINDWLEINKKSENTQQPTDGSWEFLKRKLAKMNMLR